ncbi:hypothetical protein [Jeotgalibacillus haloalkalitolerans]|uniref:DUF1836 domain-containing protein n=1 Tax=Jeotgalibacillus haloalkalitolerans TaxID=3104292 RepID=A0ABU5KNX0_9BACL|nr:hypothetical protein [Jeotgalibacillus sp. HH7-29]MDZ5712783.1 hypothetical protein [Jeotgalibacillus sp. HH7-29]
MSQDVKLDEKEYQKLSLHFRNVASRFLNSNIDDAPDNLERFLIFIEDSPIINEFIHENNKVTYDIEKVLKSRNYNDQIKLPIRKSEEIAFIFQLINYVSINKFSYYSLVTGYGRNFNDMCNNFHNNTIKPLVDHIVSYLGEMAIDMGLNKKSGTQFNIGDFRGQLNHAEGQASISAEQTYNETKVEELKDVAQKFAKALMEDTSIPDTDKEDTVELVEAAVQEVESEKPKKIILKTAIENVKNIKEVATTGTAVYTLGDQLLTLIQSFS